MPIDLCGLEGGSKLQILPNFVSQYSCELLLNELQCSTDLRQYQRKKTWDERRLHMLCHEDAIRGCSGPGYSYKDVKMLGVPLKEYPELCKLAMALGKACGVLSWSIDIDVIHYINDRDGVGWHTDVAQGATMVAAVVIATGSESRPIKIREFGRNKEIRNYPEYELDLTRGSVYVMNGVMQKHYQHMVPPLTNKRRTAPTRVNEHRIAIVFRDGVRKDVEIDSGIPASQSS